MPRHRLYLRYLTHAMVWLNTLSFDIPDSMCGLRVYPLSVVLPVIGGGTAGPAHGFRRRGAGAPALARRADALAADPGALPPGRRLPFPAGARQLADHPHAHAAVLRNAASPPRCSRAAAPAAQRPGVAA